MGLIFAMNHSDSEKRDRLDIHVLCANSTFSMSLFLSSGALVHLNKVTG